MNALGRFSIRTRLYFGTVFSLVLLVVIGAMGYVALDRTRGTLHPRWFGRVKAHGASDWRCRSRLRDCLIL